jgi:hypothetical protein
MTSLSTWLVGSAVAIGLGVGVPSAFAQSSADKRDVIQDNSAIVDPDATVVGTATPTATASATTTPISGAEGTVEATATPEGARTREDFIEPGYGSAAQQSPARKKQERRTACRAGGRPPTSHMLGTMSAIAGDTGAGWVPLVIAIAVGAAIVAGVAFASRRRSGDTTRPGALEGVAVLVAVCGGLAGLAGQFIPGATVTERPAKEATMVVRDVKKRITRVEYAKKIGVDTRRLRGEDRDEVGHVVWLQISLTGFKGEPLRVQYGEYDVGAAETLLPGTGKQVGLKAASSDVETIFLPVWVGLPRSSRFVAEFRLVDHRGRVQELAATNRMKGSRFRYSCEGPA